jgi:hypothetical protein
VNNNYDIIRLLYQKNNNYYLPVNGDGNNRHVPGPDADFQAGAFAPIAIFSRL